MGRCFASCLKILSYSVFGNERPENKTGSPGEPESLFAKDVPINTTMVVYQTAYAFAYATTVII